MSGFNLDDYVDVAERIRLFYEKWPDGRIVTMKFAVEIVGDRPFALCHAQAYRTPDDPRPCSGTAWEPIPGPTPYTKDSELMNAETAAWGRAIIAAGIPSKKIASADEVKARVDGNVASSVASTDKAVTKAQHAKIGAVIKELTEVAPEQDWTQNARGWIDEQFGKKSRADLTTVEAGKLIDYLEGLRELQKVPFS